MKNKEYKVGQEYTIFPFGNRPKSYTDKTSGYKAICTGYITNNTYNGATELLYFPVFYFDFFDYGDPKCYMALCNGECWAYGKTVKEMKEAFFKKFNYIGEGYEEIEINGIGPVSKEEFLNQIKDLEIPQDHIDFCLKMGRWQGITGKNGGSIKVCPDCKAIRQTGCSACGCGSCSVCDYRWSCMPPMDYWAKPITLSKSTIKLTEKFQKDIESDKIENLPYYLY